MIGRSFFPFVIAATLAAVAFRMFPLALMLAMLLVSSGLAALWATQSLRRVEYRRRFSQTRVFWGEDIELAVEVVNRKIMPLAWLEVDDEVPMGLAVTEDMLMASSRPRRVLLSNMYSLSPYERVTRRYRLHCTRRGYWEFGPAVIRSGDVFGFGQREKTVGEIDHLLIYPRIVPVEELGFPSKQPFGDFRARERLFEDPTRLRAVRPFEPGDPLKRVHWKATARTGKVQVKQFDPTATLDLLVIINVASYENTWQGVRTDYLETVVTVAASVADYALAAGFPVGLMANTSMHGADRPLKFAPASGPDQRIRLLESLAKLTSFVSVPLDDLLRRERRSLPWAATLVLVSSSFPEGLLAVMDALARAGHPVVIVAVGDEDPGRLAGIRVYRVPAFDDIHIHEEPALVF